MEHLTIIQTTILSTDVMAVIILLKDVSLSANASVIQQWDDRDYLWGAIESLGCSRSKYFS